MFGKIKDKLKNVFEKTEEVIEENPDSEEEVSLEELPDHAEEKKGFLSKIFGKKKEEDTEVEELPAPEEEKPKKEDKPKKEKKKPEKKKDDDKKDKEEDKPEEKEEVEDKKEEKPKKEKQEKKKEEPKEEEKEPEPEPKKEEPPAPEPEVEKEPEPKEEPKPEEKVEEKQEKKEEEIKPEDDIPLPPAPEPEPEEIPEPESEQEVEQPKEEKKKGFFSRVFGKKDDTTESEPESESDEQAEPEEASPPATKEQVQEKESKNLDEEAQGMLSKTFTKLKAKKITEEDYERIWLELEIFLLEINIAYEIVQTISEKLKEELVGNSFNRFKLSDKIRQVLETEVETVMKDREANFLEQLKEIKQSDEVVKILVLGVNGTGKTTTLAKIVKYLRDNGYSSVVAAADTFRAAAVEQLEEHSRKLDFKLILHRDGSDPAAVAYDAIEHAKAKKIDVVLIDTAGRMPNNSNLMLELQKVKRVSDAQMAVFVGDSISGNDLIDQIELFNKGVEIDGAILTKVDTDERPGSIVTTAYSIEKPIYFLGTGQTYDDLTVFDAKHIAKKLFEMEDEDN